MTMELTDYINDIVVFCLKEQWMIFGGARAKIGPRPPGF